ncbi:MAG: hypothetical protein LBI78_07525 [Campylobacteraceae bacterium]|jgi:hypothetical protein|nr:hypothetical protein [Campylobacteraceae bacterium]
MKFPDNFFGAIKIKDKVILGYFTKGFLQPFIFTAEFDDTKRIRLVNPKDIHFYKNKKGKVIFCKELK